MIIVVNVSSKAAFVESRIKVHRELLALRARKIIIGKKYKHHGKVIHFHVMLNLSFIG